MKLLFTSSHWASFVLRVWRQGLSIYCMSISTWFTGASGTGRSLKQQSTVQVKSEQMHNDLCGRQYVHCPRFSSDQVVAPADRMMQRNGSCSRSHDKIPAPAEASQQLSAPSGRGQTLGLVIGAHDTSLPRGGIEMNSSFPRLLVYCCCYIYDRRLLSLYRFIICRQCARRLD